MYDHLKRIHNRVWMLLDNRTITVLVTALSFLFGAVAAGEHFRTNVIDRLAVVERWEKHEEERLERIENQHLELMREVNQNHIDDLNFQNEAMKAIHAQAAAPDVVIRYRSVPAPVPKRGVK